MKLLTVALSVILQTRVPSVCLYRVTRRVCFAIKKVFYKSERAHVCLVAFRQV